MGVLQSRRLLLSSSAKLKQIKSIGLVNMNQRLKITNLVGHIKETMSNGHLKILNLFYEVLRLDISNFKSTGRL